MKIALLLTGKTDYGVFCFPYIYNNFINIPYEVETYIHSWEENYCTKLYNPKNIIIEKQEIELLKDFLSNFEIRDDVFKNAKLPNFLFMHYSLNKGFELIPKDCDIVIRCRFDFFAYKKDWLFVINDILNDKYDIFIPDPIENWNGYQDRLAIGKYSAMKEYCNTFYNIGNLANKYKFLHPERILKFNLEENKIRVFQKDIFNHSIIKKVSFISQNQNEFILEK